MGMLLRRYNVGVVNTAPTIPFDQKPIEETVIEEVKEIEIPEVKEEKKFSRSEIQLMKTDQLQGLAVELGIEDAKEISGNKLKPIIMKKLGL